MRYPHLGQVGIGDETMVAAACLGTRGPNEMPVSAVLMIPLDDDTVTTEVRAAAATIRAWWESQLSAKADDLMRLGTDTWLRGGQP